MQGRRGRADGLCSAADNAAVRQEATIPENVPEGGLAGRQDKTMEILNGNIDPKNSALNIERSAQPSDNQEQSINSGWF